jgi:hypothetical protein
MLRVMAFTSVSSDEAAARMAESFGRSRTCFTSTPNSSYRLKNDWSTPNHSRRVVMSRTRMAFAFRFFWERK